MAHQFHHRYVLFDLEFLGNIQQGAEQCRIFEIAAVDKSTTTEFQIYVDPYPGQRVFPPPVQDACFKITRQFCDDNNIETLDTALPKFFTWLDGLGSQYCTLISHACFRSDMLVFKHSCDRLGITWPDNIRFADSLNILRICIPTAKRFSLDALHILVCGTSLECPHSALFDARGLKRVMECFPYFEQFTTVFAIHQHPYSLLKGIGAKTELLLVHSGFDPLRPCSEILRMLNPEQQNTLYTACDGIYKSDTHDDPHRCATKTPDRTMDTSKTRGV